MIRRNEDCRIDKIQGLKDGKGYITIQHFFEPEDFMGTGRLFGKATIKPGHSIGYHKHVGDQEAYFVLKGQALYIEEGVESTLGIGDVSICKEGESHSIEAIGEEDLELIMLILYSNCKSN